MKYIFFLFVFFLQGFAFANDGAYYASGNHLIPVMETDVAVTKEILTVKKVRNTFIEVTVYYEFFNPGKEKNVLVGFEAFSPSGDVNGTPKNGKHPYMKDFTVNLNNTILDYKVAYVQDSAYVKNGKITSLSGQALKAAMGDVNAVDFYYVYYFDAHFKKGLNTITHTYTYNVSGGIENSFDFQYILTAANRWANKQIDDFTLIVDMGEFEAFNIDQSFFSDAGEWQINGTGKSGAGDPSPYEEDAREAVKFTIQQGNLVFKKKNFHPEGELYVYAQNRYFEEEIFTTDVQLPFSYYQQDRIPPAGTELGKKILKNLPFARRGYVFTNKEIAAYYEKQDWYMPNADYKPDVTLLSEEEKKWVKGIEN